MNLIVRAFCAIFQRDTPRHIRFNLIRLYVVAFAMLLFIVALGWGVVFLYFNIMMWILETLK